MNPPTDRACNREIWDLPIRIFHWMLVAAVTTAWLTTSTLYFELHLFTGYLILLLLGFRLLWGFFGGFHSRFHNLLHPWRAVQHHLKQLVKGKHSQKPGHNPAGSWMILLILGLLSLISASGLLALGGEEQLGPLAGLLSIELGAHFHTLHQWLAWGLISLIPIHLAGILIETIWGKRSLISAMVTGREALHFSSAELPAERSRLHSGLTALLLTSTPLWALWIITIQPEQHPPLYHTVALEQHQDYALWQEECGGCHTLHHPSLLPQRSWQTMLERQQDHFEEDLSLDRETIIQMQHFLTHFAAEQARSEAAWKIPQSIPPTDAPLRITETGYWKRKHASINSEIWHLPSVNGKLNCDACHLDAAEGYFQDHAVQIPGV